MGVWAPRRCAISGERAPDDVGGAPTLRASLDEIVAARAAEAAAREDAARAAATRAPEQPKGLKGGGWVEVDVSEARALMAADKGGTSDPYAVVELVAGGGGAALKGETYKTKTHKRTLEPKFGESFTLGAAVSDDAKLAAATLRVRVLDYDGPMSAGAPLGEVALIGPS